ncbi:MAG: hypothetical protein R3E39_21295 [Anaerolineae bacterium]
MQPDPSGDFHYRAPLKLKRLQEWLQNVTLSSQPAQSYDTENWLSKIQAEELRSIFERHPSEIKRIDIVALAREASENPSESNIRRVFLATMLWGYTNVGYGPWRVARMLEDITKLDEILIEAHKAIRSSDVRQAYTILQDAQITYFGPPIFTKFLYFAGLGCGVDHYPLIYDSRVRGSLQELLGDKTPPPVSWKVISNM